MVTDRPHRLAGWEWWNHFGPFFFFSAQLISFLFSLFTDSYFSPLYSHFLRQSCKLEGLRTNPSAGGVYWWVDVNKPRWKLVTAHRPLTEAIMYRYCDIRPIGLHYEPCRVSLGGDGFYVLCGTLNVSGHTLDSVDNRVGNNGECPGLSLRLGNYKVQFLVYRRKWRTGFPVCAIGLLVECRPSRVYFSFGWLLEF